jgi:tetrahydromethanopterin S-methyltransferase subunit G
MTSNTETLLIIFVALTGVAVLLQACVLLAIYISLKKTAKSALEASDDFKATVLPMVHSTRELVERIAPQIVTITSDLAELATVLKKEGRGVSFSAAEIMQRVGRQAERLDGMLTTGLNAVDRAGVVVESAVAAPVRQMNGILAAIKAVIETYKSDTPRRRSSPSNPSSPSSSVNPLNDQGGSGI